MKRLFAKLSLRSIIIFFVIGVLLSIPAFLYSSPLTFSKWMHGCFSPFKSNEACYDRYYSALAKNDGVANALSELHRREAWDVGLRSRCHNAMHIIGRVAYREYGSIGDAYAHADYGCWSGYSHGVVEGALRGRTLGSVSKEELQDMCNKLPTRELPQFNCVHGLGHALMYIADNDLPLALNHCDDLWDDWSRIQCVTGAFMENTLSNADHPSKFVSESDPYFPCNALDKKYGEACYLVQSIFVMRYAHDDLATAFSVCDRISEEPYREQCARGLGKRAAELGFYKAEETARLCTLASGYNGLYENCLYGALQDMRGATLSDDAGKALCAVALTGYEATCTRMLTQDIDRWSAPNETK